MGCDCQLVIKENDDDDDDDVIQQNLQVKEIYCSFRTELQ